MRSRAGSRRRLATSCASRRARSIQHCAASRIAAGSRASGDSPSTTVARNSTRSRLLDVAICEVKRRVTHGREPMSSLAQHLRFAVRGLRRQPAFTTAAVLTLAVGIGASTAIFGVVNAVLLQPLPYRDPDRLVGLWHRSPIIETTL